MTSVLITVFLVTVNSKMAILLFITHFHPLSSIFTFFHTKALSYYYANYFSPHNTKDVLMRQMTARVFITNGHLNWRRIPIKEDFLPVTIGFFNTLGEATKSV